MNKYIISPKVSIKKTLGVMDDLLASTLFIEDNGQLIGSVSSGDIRRALLQEVDLETLVTKIMNTNPVCLEENYEKSFAKKLFLDKKISAIPILDNNGKVIDVILRSDILENYHEVCNKIDLSVVIMAGGKGARLDPFTRILPKALIPIEEKPIIEVIMEEYSKYGMDNFIISLNHKSKMIKAFFQEHKSFHKIDFIKEDIPLGTAGALGLIVKKIKSPFFVSNCDVIIKADYTEIYNFHKKKGVALTLVASMQEHVIPYGVCELCNGGLLKAIKEKPGYDLLVNTGMYIINPEVLKFIPANTAYDMTDLINKLKDNNYKIGVYPIPKTSWLDVGQWGKYRKSIDKLNSFFEEDV